MFGVFGINISCQIDDEELWGCLWIIVEDVMIEDFGLILWLSCVGVLDDDLVEDIVVMQDLVVVVMVDVDGVELEVLIEGDGLYVLVWCEWSEWVDVDIDEGVFEYLGVLDQMEQLCDLLVMLSDGSMYVEVMCVLVVVDVNIGGDILFVVVFKCNFVVVWVLLWVLCLCGLGGQIVIDFVLMFKVYCRQIE